MVIQQCMYRNILVHKRFCLQTIQFMKESICQNSASVRNL